MRGGYGPLVPAAMKCSNCGYSLCCPLFAASNRHLFVQTVEARRAFAGLEETASSDETIRGADARVCSIQSSEH
jgi:hypothetical protein